MSADAKIIARMHDAIVQALEYLDGREDVDDGADGQPVANREMQLAQTLREAVGESSNPYVNDDVTRRRLEFAHKEREALDLLEHLQNREVQP